MRISWTIPALCLLGAEALTIDRRKDSEHDHVHLTSYVSLSESAKPLGPAANHPPTYPADIISLPAGEIMLDWTPLIDESKHQHFHNPLSFMGIFWELEGKRDDLKNWTRLYEGPHTKVKVGGMYPGHTYEFRYRGTDMTAWTPYGPIVNHKACNDTTKTCDVDCGEHGHGRCDYCLGSCKCNPGWKGPTCKEEAAVKEVLCADFTAEWGQNQEKTQGGSIDLDYCPEAVQCVSKEGAAKCCEVGKTYEGNVYKAGDACFMCCKEIFENDDVEDKNEKDKLPGQKEKNPGISFQANATSHVSGQAQPVASATQLRLIALAESADKAVFPSQ